MTRWTKLSRDIWSNRSRSLLVILSITVGVFAVGMISLTRQALTRSLHEQYLAIHPAEAIIQTLPGMDDDLVTAIRHTKGVTDAEGRRSLPLRLSQDGAGETWRDLTLYSLADYKDQHLFTIHLEDGSWPPKKGEVLMERASMAFLGLKTGDTILIKTASGKQARLEVKGTVLDLYREPPLLDGWLYGYVSQETIRWLGEPDGYNELYLDTAGVDRVSVNRIVERVSDRLKGEALPVYKKTVINQNSHPLEYIIDTIVLLLGLVAVLSMGLSALLVINIISALIAQQEKQIGIMKAIGARSGQIIGMYVCLVILLGLAAVILALPLSYVGARHLAAFVAGLMNFDPPEIHFSVTALLIQLGVGLLVPLLAAAPSILTGTRVSPAKVLSEYGLNEVWSGGSWLDSILRRFPGLTRIQLLALRNPFRKRGRLILSLVTLTFAGAVFMASINLQASLNETLNHVLHFWRYDAWIILDEYVPVERLESEALRVKGVTSAEAWDYAIGRYVRPDDSESDDLYIMAPPKGTRMIDPPIITGRGLRPDDENAILVTPGFLSIEPGLKLGSWITLKIDGRKQNYQIVGIMNMLSSSSIGYFTITDYNSFAHQVREMNRANAVVMNLAPGKIDWHDDVSSQVEDLFDRDGMDVVSTILIDQEREETDNSFQIIVALLLVMTILLAAVGGLGLAGTMSLNVIDRTREIGVMRAFGASSRHIFKVVIVEGLVIGGISWVLSIVLAVPLSMGLASVIGVSFMNNPMPAAFSAAGVLYWALLVTAIAVVASISPALRAVRLTVTEVLAYE